MEWYILRTKVLPPETLPCTHVYSSEAIAVCTCWEEHPVRCCGRPQCLQVFVGCSCGALGSSGSDLWLLTLQRVGYLAASQCFHEGTDVIMLTTNQIRKVGPAAFLTLK